MYKSFFIDLFFSDSLDFQSDVVLIMTCSIRDGAEQKIWKRLEYLKFLKRKRSHDKSSPPMKIGILGKVAIQMKLERKRDKSSNKRT